MASKERIEEMRVELRARRLERQLKQEETAIRMMEGFPFDGERGRVVEPRARDEGEDISLTPQEIQKGAHEAFRTETELWEMQAIGELLATRNSYCIGTLRALTNYVMGSGFRYEVVAKNPEDPIAVERKNEGQAEADRFIVENRWGEWEREIFHRTRRHGEAWLRTFATEDVLQIRSIEPRMICQPANVIEGPEWAFGVHCDPEDQQTVLGYNVSYSMDPAKGDEIPASEIHHYKINVDRIVRRGVSDFFAVAGEADSIKKLLRNMAHGASMLACIAWIEQFSTATKSEVSDFADAVKSHTQRDPRNAQSVRYERMRPGAVPRIGAGKQYVAPPLATANTINFLEIHRAGRQALLTRWNAPESLSGDASNGTFSSLSVAESPFVIGAEVEQGFYRDRNKEVVVRAINHGIARGRVSADFWRYCDLKVEGRKLIVRDPLQQAQVNEIEARSGVLSPQTWAAENERDWSVEAAEIKRAQQMGIGPPAAVPPVPGAAPPGSPPFAFPVKEGKGGPLDPFELWKRLGL